MDVLRVLAAGHTSAEAAIVLRLSRRTVRLGNLHCQFMPTAMSVLPVSGGGRGLFLPMKIAQDGLLRPVRPAAAVAMASG
jgi:hypothetical protein